jgi:predicted DNA-binding WGR domain protein
MAVFLRKVDAEKNMARFYSIDIAPTLFGDVSVLRSWGRIGTNGRMSVETCATMDEVEQRAMKTMKAKLRRGYGAV